MRVAEIGLPPRFSMAASCIPEFHIPVSEHAPETSDLRIRALHSLARAANAFATNKSVEVQGTVRRGGIAAAFKRKYGTWMAVAWLIVEGAETHLEPHDLLMKFCHREDFCAVQGLAALPTCVAHIEQRPAAGGGTWTVHLKEFPIRRSMRAAISSGNLRMVQYLRRAAEALGQPPMSLTLGGARAVRSCAQGSKKDEALLLHMIEVQGSRRYELGWDRYAGDVLEQCVRWRCWGAAAQVWEWVSQDAEWQSRAAQASRTALLAAARNCDETSLEFVQGVWGRCRELWEGDAAGFNQLACDMLIRTTPQVEGPPWITWLFQKSNEGHWSVEALTPAIVRRCVDRTLRGSHREGLRAWLDHRPAIDMSHLSDILPPLHLYFWPKLSREFAEMVFDPSRPKTANVDPVACWARSVDRWQAQPRAVCFPAMQVVAREAIRAVGMAAVKAETPDRLVPMLRAEQWKLRRRALLLRAAVRKPPSA